MPGTEPAGYYKLFEDNSAVMLLIDPERADIVDANAAAARYYGYTREALRSMKITDINTLTPDEMRVEMARVKSLDRNWFEFRHRLSGGELRDVNVASGPVVIGGRELLLSTVIDIGERKRAEAHLRLAASVFTHAREGITITDIGGNIVEVNDAFTRLTGYSRAEVVGKNPRILQSGRHDRAFYDAMWKAITGRGHWHGEIWNRRKNGDIYAEMLTISAVRDDQGRTQNYVALFTDISALKEHERQLEHIAHFDSLTGLPNRVLLADRLHQAMAQTQRRGQLLAVAYLDLDGFKAVNDALGHEAGDQLLITLSGRMRAVLREGDSIARLGGDEFVAVLIDLDRPEDCLPLLARLHDAAAQPVDVLGLPQTISASIGVTFFPQKDTVDADQLLRQADQAMYQAKLAGKNRYHVFDAEQDSAVKGLHANQGRIQHALAEREFVLHYQPKVNMRTGEFIGAEALIRWQHPQLGLLPPGMFLPIIEDHPISIPLGEWVIDDALTQIETWRAAGLDIPVSVNIGSRQLQQPDFMDRLRELLAAHPAVGPGRLELEVLETSALEDMARVSAVMHACREIGVGFALDDFGTGYSSLTYLKRLPAALLKIDQSFVRDMLDDPEDLAILEGVLGLATAFRRQAIAEGVETLAHGELLLLLGCELAQGYGIARPMPADELPAWVAGWRPDARWANLRAVDREDLPLLFCGVEHRAWIRAIEECLRDGQDSPPLLEAHQCRFGQWQDGGGDNRYAGHPAFPAIETVHRRVHVLGAELIEMKHDGRAVEALARLHELLSLRDGMLGLMKPLVSREAGIAAKPARTGMAPPHGTATR